MTRSNKKIRDNNEIISGDNKNEHNKLKKNKINKESSEIDVTNLSKQTTTTQLNDIGQGERLFWKVFRNIFLNREIMSNMNIHLYGSYHSIISVTNMIKLGQLNLLRDKVIRNQYLTFSGHSNYIFNEIFGVIKNDDDQDRLFYQQLFKHYGQHSLAFNNVVVEKKVLKVNENGREKLINGITEKGCIPALQVLIQHYQFKPTNKSLSYALFLGKFKLVKLLLKESKFGLQIDKSYERDKDIRYIKILNYLYDEKLIDSQVVNQNLNRISNNKRIEERTLKSLIGISKLILKSKNQVSTTVKVEEIETFSNNLTKQELKSTLSDKSNQIESKKEMIKKLLQLLCSFLNVKKSQFYYIYFCSDGTYTDSDIGTCQTPTEAYLSSFRFADTKLVTLFETYDIGVSKEPDLLFSHCQDDNDKQMKFINLIISKIRGNNDFIDPIIFFYLVIYNDDLDQIKYVANQLKDYSFIDSIGEKGCLWFITNYIRSKLVLEWLFENYYSLFIYRSTIWYFRSVELLQHYEKLYQLKCKSDENEKNSSLIELLPIPDIDNDQSYNIEILKHFIKSGSTVYQLDFNEYFGGDNIFSSICSLTGYSENDKFEMLKLVYTNFSNGIDQLIEYFDPNNPPEAFETICLVKFVDWFYRNYQHKYNKSKHLKRNEAFGIFLLKIGIHNEETDKHCIGYIKSNPNQSNVEYLDIVLKNNGTDKTSIKTILKDACKYGKLNTIQHIHQNYNWLFIQKSDSNPNGLFTTEELNSLLISSLEYDQLVVSDYLFELLFTITKKQFDSDSGDISKLYYKNKSFK